MFTDPGCRSKGTLFLSMRIHIPINKGQSGIKESQVIGPDITTSKKMVFANPFP
jgi:hypothetical protein